VRQDLDDLLVAVASRAYGLHVGFAHLPARFHQLERKAQRRSCLGIGGVAALRGRHFFGAGACLAAQGRVGRKAVFASVAVGHRHRDLFAQLGGNDPAAQRAEGAPHALQRSRRIGHGLEHVRRCAKGAVDLREQRLAVRAGAAGIDKRNSGHVGNSWK
jgi:hypothetical protein